jgi:hypothetical protein
VLEQEKKLVIKEVEEDRESWRVVVNLSEADKVSVSEDRDFEETDIRSRTDATFLASVVKQ